MKKIRYADGIPELCHMVSDIADRNEAISHAQIVEYADAIIHLMKEKPQESLVVQSLSDHNLMESFIRTHVTDPTFRRSPYQAELLDGIRSIRSAIIRELATRLHFDTLFIPEKYIRAEPIKDDQLSYEIEGSENTPKLICYTPDGRMWLLRGEPDARTNDFLEAVEKLKNLPPNRHIVQVREVMINTRRLGSGYYHSPNVLVEYVPLSIINPNRQPLKKNLQIMHDVMSGCIFLEQNGLVLQDITMHNIGSRLDTGEGFLFDIDGLVLVGKTKDAIGNKHYKPPEYDVERYSFPVAHPTVMVYQLGACLQRLIRIAYSENHIKRYISQPQSPHPDIITRPSRIQLEHFIPEEVVDAFLELSEKMCEENPSDRPTLVAAQAELTLLMERYNDALEDADAKLLRSTASDIDQRTK